jgi:hypothetical protein
VASIPRLTSGLSAKDIAEYKENSNGLRGYAECFDSFKHNQRQELRNNDAQAACFGAGNLAAIVFERGSPGAEASGSFRPESVDSGYRHAGKGQSDAHATWHWVHLTLRGELER